jgi:hypothetical protein
MRSLPLLLLLLCAPSASRAVTISFAEFGTSTLIDANGIQIQGVTFGFNAGQATYNQTVGTAGNAVLSVDPVLSGPTSGVLNLTFNAPTPLLQFDVLLQSISTIDDSNLGFNGGPAYTVILSNGLSFDEGTAPQISGGYSEGAFSYSGAAITGATISFFNGLDASGLPVSQFGFDNLTFSAVKDNGSGIVTGGAFGTPEPASFLSLSGGLLALCVIKRRPAGSKHRS